MEIKLFDIDQFNTAFIQRIRNKYPHIRTFKPNTDHVRINLPKNIEDFYPDEYEVTLKKNLSLVYFDGFWDYDKISKNFIGVCLSQSLFLMFKSSICWFTF